LNKPLIFDVDSGIILSQVGKITRTRENKI
jgi:hypothetical protein